MVIDMVDDVASYSKITTAGLYVGMITVQCVQLFDSCFHDIKERMCVLFDMHEKKDVH